MTPLQLRLKELREKSVPGHWYLQDADLTASAPALLTLAETLLEALELFKLDHEHGPDLFYIRVLGDTYGWCDYCQEKVTFGPGDAELAIAKAEQLFIEKEERL